MSTSKPKRLEIKRNESKSKWKNEHGAASGGDVNDGQNERVKEAKMKENGFKFEFVCFSWKRSESKVI